MISVLCVDDEQELLDLYKLFLEQSDEIQVDTADSVKMALGKLKKCQYDVIVSDYSMPEYDGVAFLKCILPTYGDIPFILFTGKGCEDTVIEALNNGARFYIQKGGDPKEQFADLIHKIKQAVGLKEVEDALRTSELRYRNLFETANDGILLLDADTGEIMNANPSLVNLIGSSLEEMLGRHIWDIGVFKDVDLVKKAFLELQTKKIIRYEELPLITKHDQEIIVEFVGTVYTVDHADVIQCNIRDITERKRTEEALRESEEKFRSLVEHALEGILILDLQGTILFVNNAAARTIEADGCAGLIGRNVMEFIAPESREDVVNDFIQVSQGHDAYLAQYNAISAKGNKFYVESIGKVITYEGKTADLISIRDITERKLAEEQLKRFNEELESQVRSRTAELERINTLLGNEAIQRTQAEESVRKSLNEREHLLREVHHRVGNNLQIMLSLINLQSRVIKDQELLDTMGEFRNRIMAMAHVHERMCRSSDISRIDLSEICTFLGTSLFRSYNVDPHFIRLNVEIKDLPITIESAIPISLIINELILNSIKHAFPKGTTGEITIAGRHEADSFVLSFRDTGVGIPKDLDWMKSNQSLGLRLVMSLVEQLNGTIELDRTTGTAFNIIVKENQ